MAEETLYLVDGSGYIYRAFYAVQPLSNSAGLPTNALFGFSRMITKLLRDVSAKYIAVAFDSKDPTFRHLKYDNYKANRRECPPELVKQMPYFRELTSAYGIKVLEQSGIEADDILATIALKNSSLPVTIVSGDKDLCQMVDDRVTVWDAMRDIRYNAAAVEAKFGVKPTQIVDYLALTGDTSDNVPGIAGVGPKTAAQLLNTFGSIAGIYSDLSAVSNLKGLRGASRIKELLEAGQEKLKLSQWLVTLLTEVEEFSSISPEEFLWHGPKENELRELLKILEFRSALLSAPDEGNEETKSKVKKSSVEEFSLTPVSTQSVTKPKQPKTSSAPKQDDLFPEIKKPVVIRDYQLVNKDNITELITALEHSEIFAFDTETDSLNPFDAKLVGLSFAVKNSDGELKSYFVPSVKKEDRTYFTWEELKERFDPIFASDKLKLGSNLKYDLAVLRTNGLKVAPPFGDTMLLSYVLNPDLRQHGLKDLSRKLLNEEMVSYTELLKGRGSIFEVPVDELGSYASHDAEATFKIYEKLITKLPAEQRLLYQDIELGVLTVLEEIERTGIKLDRSILKKMSEEFELEIKKLEEKLIQLSGREINLNSPKQLSALLFEEFRLPTAGIKKTTHGFSTDASALERLARAHPFPAQLLEYRELFKLKSTYLDALQKIVRPDTGRIHTSFNQAVAATGRLSSSDPNLQNIPIRNDRGRKIRTAFVADSGFKLICADYSQVELRILAHLASDTQLQTAFASGADIHNRTAELIFQSQYLEADEARKKELRRYAKTINFGVIYGMGASRLADELSISRGEAGEFIKHYFENYSGVRTYFDDLEESAKRLGYVETLFGRRRYLQDIDTSGRDYNYAVRSVLNAPIQGTAADIMKLAMINLDYALKKYYGAARMVLQVHDELLVEVRDDIADEVNEIVVNTMKNAAKLSVPLEVDSRIRLNWS